MEPPSGSGVGAGAGVAEARVVAVTAGDGLVAVLDMCRVAVGGVQDRYRLPETTTKFDTVSQ